MGIINNVGYPSRRQHLGVDVYWLATIAHSAGASFAVLLAIYAAVTVRDPMTKRVKALNERREQLKAGITASTAKKRAKAGAQTETTDRMRQFLSSLKVLQDDQIKVAQQKLAQAGIRRKELAVASHFQRAGRADPSGRRRGLLWIYGMGGLADWTDFKRFCGLRCV
jgi:tight adherence protein C